MRCTSRCGHEVSSLMCCFVDFLVCVCVCVVFCVILCPVVEDRRERATCELRSRFWFKAAPLGLRGHRSFGKGSRPPSLQIV